MNSSVSDLKINEKTSVVIIGGGITGLTVAWKLCKNGINVTLLERQKFVGGFARGINHNGYSVDIGPHYFSISENSVIEEIKNLMGKDNLITIPDDFKIYKIFFRQKTFDPKSNIYDVLRILGHTFFVRCMSSYLVSKLTNFTKKIETSKDYMISNYGSYFYYQFLKPYFLIKFDNQNPPLDLVKSIFPPLPISKLFSSIQSKKSVANVVTKNKKKLKGLKFYNFYLKYGMSSLINEIKNEITNLGGKIILGAEITSISHEKTKLISYNLDGKQIDFKVDKIVYAIPLQNITRWFENFPITKSSDPKQVKTSRLIMVYLFVDSPRLFDSWCLVVISSDLSFFRISQQNFLTPNLVPKGKTALTVEINSDDESLWKLNDEALMSRIKNELTQIEILKNEKIDDYKILKLERGFSKSADDLIKSIKKYVNSIPNEYPVGVKDDSGSLVSPRVDTEKIQTSESGGLNQAFIQAEYIVNEIISERMK